MTIQELKDTLTRQQHTKGDLLFKLDNGLIIPPYFHITEMGIKTKHFVDCGGTLRSEQKITFQIWTADDFNHRLTPSKFLEIINKALSLPYFQNCNLDVEMEYQDHTIGLYSLEKGEGLTYLLKSKKTNCLAPDKCGISTNQPTTSQPPTVTPIPSGQAKKQCGPSCC
tara:strand:+ start:233 stop:736 length:504 start_codon:yes stop_codon:yes gene_type:complete